MINKKIKILCAALMAASLSLIAVGCQGGGGTSTGNSGNGPTYDTPVTGDTSITLKNVPESRTFVLGESPDPFAPQYTKTDGYTLSYESSNENVVTVSRYGQVTLVGIGEATVTVKYSNGTNNVTKSCTVTVGLGQYEPMLKLGDVVDGAVSIGIGEDYTLQTYVDFNNQAFQGAQLTYEIADTTIATVDENGKITPKKNGETELRINGTWNGKTLDTCSTNLKVLQAVEFSNDGEPFVESVTLYTTANFDGKTYATTIPKKFKISVGSTTGRTATVEEIPSDGVSLLNIGRSVITASAYGTTTLKVSATIDGTEYARYCTVNVVRPTMKITETVPTFATNIGTWVDANDNNTRKSLLEFDGIKNNLLDGSKTLVDAYQDGKKLTFDNDTSAIKGVISSENSKRGTATITIGTAKAMYEVTMETLGNVVYTAEDLVAMSASGANNGYWELNNNINATGTTISQNAATFTGTFNGNGYTISNLTIGEDNSLFGGGSSTSVVKNLALKDLTATKAYYFFKKGAGDGTTIDNIYIHLSSSTQNPKGLVAYSGDGGMQVFTNILVEYDSSIRYDSTYNTNHGVLLGDLSITNPAEYTIPDSDPNDPQKIKYKTFNGEKPVDKEWVNVFVVSKHVLSYNPTQMESIVNDVKVYEAIGVYGANETKDVNDKDIVTEGRTFSGVYTADNGTSYYNVKLQKAYRYDTLDAMKDDESFKAADLGTFNSEFWTTSTSGGAKTLVWKGRQA